MSIHSEHNIAIFEDPRSEKKIIYLPLAGYAQLLTVTEVEELTSRLYNEQDTSASAAVQNLMSKLPEKNQEVFLTSHTVEGLRSLMILPNNKCNFHCSYCYSASGRSNQEISQTLLEAGLRYFLDVNRAKDERLSITVLGGGEPLLSWNTLKPAIENAICLVAQRGASCPISLVTNGSICTKEIIDFCIRHNISLSVSFDILEDVQDAQRERWKDVSKNINRFTDAGIDVALNTVISRDNVKRMPEMVEHLKRFHPNVRKVSFKSLITKKIFLRVEDRQAYYKDFISEFFKAKHLADEYDIGLTCSYMNICLFLADRYCPGKFVITSEGDISICHMVGSRNDKLYDKFIFGKIDEKSGEVFVDEEKLEKILSFSASTNERCNDCSARWHCAGGCYADYFHLNEQEHEAYCNSMREFLANYLIYKYKL